MTRNWGARGDQHLRPTQNERQSRNRMSHKKKHANIEQKWHLIRVDFQVRVRFFVMSLIMGNKWCKHLVAARAIHSAANMLRICFFEVVYNELNRVVRLHQQHRLNSLKYMLWVAIIYARKHFNLDEHVINSLEGKIVLQIELHFFFRCRHFCCLMIFRSVNLTLFVI